MIIFHSVSYKNFLSTGNTPIVISLDTHNMTLVGGPNGTGKSLMIDAICFALFGRAYRDITKPLLVNSINQKQCVVEILFAVGPKKYKVVRGIKPNIFEIWDGDKLINQDPNVKDYQKVLEQQILQMNYKSFTQVVVMGSGSYIPFMKLTTKERRDFIEDLLDIRIFSAMNTLLKEQIKTTKENIREVETEIKLIREKITLQESFIKKQVSEREGNKDLLEKEISELMDENSAHQKEVDTLMEQVNQIHMINIQFSDASELLSEKRIVFKNLKKNINALSEDKTFYNSLDSCPQCKQLIGSDHRKHILRSVEGDIRKHQELVESIESDIVILTEQNAKWDANLTEIEELNKTISQLNKSIMVNHTKIKSKEEIIEKSSSDTSSIDESRKVLKGFAKDILAQDKKRQELNESLHYRATEQTLLQDTGIKAKIINQYVPIINKLVNKYLDSMDFFVSFNLNENFEEIVKSRHRDTFRYESFSEGQKLRIDIALLFAWRDIARLKNSVNCNLLWMDEILDASLDLDGADLLLSLLATQNDTNTFIISHRDGIADKFDHVIAVSMKNNFTCM